MFIAALFTIDKLWMYPKCSSADKWIKNGYTQMMEYYTVIRKIKILPFASTWMNLEVYNAK